jgi:hypothetical protein
MVLNGVGQDETIFLPCWIGGYFEAALKCVACTLRKKEKNKEEEEDP